MLTNEDEEWVRKEYPLLAPASGGLAGKIAFSATYNSLSNRFLILNSERADSIGGVLLSGEFRIRIVERSNKSISSLPAVYIEDVETADDRHFSRADNSACLCSPLEESEFLEPAFHFRLFLEQLVLPFLYGQLFYFLYRRWPWSEYAHGATGLLEAYSGVAAPVKSAECLRQLTQDKNAWPRIKSALQQKPYVKGHTSCFCPKGDQIRRCHPTALKGALQLQRDIRTLAIPVP